MVAGSASDVVVGLTDMVVAGPSVKVVVGSVDEAVSDSAVKVVAACSVVSGLAHKCKNHFLKKILSKTNISL